VTASPLSGPLTSSAQAYRAVATAPTDTGGSQMSSTSHGFMWSTTEASGYAEEPGHPAAEPLGHHTGVGTGTGK
jgi:hypothetical protein